MKSFSELGLREELLTAISEMGYENPTPVQEAVIPVLLHQPNFPQSLSTSATDEEATDVSQTLSASETDEEAAKNAETPSAEADRKYRDGKIDVAFCVTYRK